MKGFWGFVTKIGLVWSALGALYLLGNERGWFDPRPVEIASSVSGTKLMISDWSSFALGIVFWWGLALAVLLAMLGIVLRFLWLPALKDYQTYDVGENGMVKPRMRVADTWWHRLNPFRETEHEVDNPALMVAPTMRMRRDGAFYNVEQHTGDIPLHDQLQIAGQLTKAPVAAAASGMAGKLGRRGKAPTSNELKERAGVFDAQAEKAEADAMISQEKLRQLTDKAKPDEPQRTNFTIMPLAEAMKLTQPTRLCIGQNQMNGSPAFWDMHAGNPHMRLHGGTQQGKTTLASVICYQMLLAGWDVIILDRRKFKDWGIFRGFAQLIDTSDPRMLIESLSIVVEQHLLRDDMVGELVAGNIDGLPDDVRPNRLGVIIDEFTTQALQVKDAGLLDAMNKDLATLAAESASNGIHLMITDQKPTQGLWHDVVKGNCGAVLTAFLPKGSGQSAGNYHAYKLGKHEFFYNDQLTGEDYPLKGWPIRDNFEHHRQRLVGRRPTHMIDVRQIKAELKAQDNAPKHRRHTVAEPQSSQPGTMSKFNQAIAFLEEYPGASQAQMRDALGFSRDTCFKAHQAFNEGVR